VDEEQTLGFRALVRKQTETYEEPCRRNPSNAFHTKPPSLRVALQPPETSGIRLGPRIPFAASSPQIAFRRYRAWIPNSESAIRPMGSNGIAP
jgi:hypothetical protein